MASKHTSTLWKWDGLDLVQSGEAITGNRVILSIGIGYDGQFGGEMPSEENAAIIAAASILYSALKSIAGEMRREHDSGDGHFSAEQIENAEAAIKAAEGDHGHK